MIPKCFKSLTNPAGRAEVIEQAAEEERKRRRDTKLVDVAHEVMRKDRKELDGLVRKGLSKVKREEFKGRVKKKVFDAVGEGFECTDEEMVEEITEKVVDASEADPYYKNMFENE